MKGAARCCCGQLQVHCEGPPDKVSVCHCDACRRRTGSAFGMAAFYPRARVRLEGEARTWSRGADGGHAVVFHFCPDCGSTLLWEPSRKPEMVAVAAGAFADPALSAPGQSVRDARRYVWIDFPDSVARRADS